MLPNIVILKVQHYLSNVCRYNWRQFAVVTSDIAGHDDFVQAVREEVITMREERNIKWADRHFYNLLNIYTSFLSRKNGNLSKTALLHESMLLEFFCIEFQAWGKIHWTKYKFVRVWTKSSGLSLCLFYLLYFLGFPFRPRWKLPAPSTSWTSCSPRRGSSCCTPPGRRQLRSWTGPRRRSWPGTTTCGSSPSPS